jgi:tetratricopeptide (TPR) repeat protein
MQHKSILAIHAFERALKLRYLPNAYALLAEEKCKVRDVNGARPMLSRILREESTNAHLIALVAPCYLQLDEPLESIQIYQRLLDQPFFPDDLARLQLVRSYLKAAQKFVGQLESSPDANVYVQAIQKARDANAGDARSAFPFAARSSSHFRPDLNFAEALKIWNEHPKDLAILYLMSVLSGEEALRQVGICQERYPDSPYLEEFRADVLANQRQLDKAAEMYESLIERYPQLSDVRHSLGMLYIEQHHWSKALTLFRIQLAEFPDDEEAANRTSECLMELQQYAELRSFLRPWVERENSPLWAHLDLASTYEMLGDFTGVIKELETAESMSPKDKKIRFRLLHLYRQSGNSVGITREGNELKKMQSDNTAP